jgi:hypothetical protein
MMTISTKEELVKYALLIYTVDSNWDGVSEAQKQAINGEYAAVNEAKGVFGGYQLQPVSTATTVRVDDGNTLLTDGPFVDAKEYLGGYYLLEAGNLDAAIEVAARIPAARMGGAVEVRPIVEQSL